METRGKFVTFWKGPPSLQNGSASVAPGKQEEGKGQGKGPGRSEVY